jgi:heat shock protein HslJ
MKRSLLVSFRLSVAAAGSLCLAAGCTTAGPSAGTLEGGAGMTPTHTYVVPVTSEPDPLNGTRWELVDFEGGPSLPEQPKLFVEFEGGALNLRGGCNRVSGHYLIEDDYITVTFSDMTLIDCSDLEEVEAVEFAFSNVMPAFETYVIEDDRLRIRHADGELLFRRVPD